MLDAVNCDWRPDLRPPEKWSLFGRTKHLIKLNISPFKTFEGGMRYLCIKWIWKPQNGYKWPLMPIWYTNKKESRSNERLSINLLIYNKLLAQCTGDIHCDSPTSWALLIFLVHQPLGCRFLRGSPSSQRVLELKKNLRTERLSAYGPLCRSYQFNWWIWYKAYLLSSCNYLYYR